ENHHRVDLELRALGQRRYLDGRTRGVRLVEVFRHHRIDHRELRQVGEVEADARDVVQRTAGRLADRAQVVEGTARLGGEVTGNEFAGGRVERDLSGQEDAAAGAHGLRIRADGGGRVGGADGVPG